MVHNDPLNFAARTATNVFQSTPGNVLIHGIIACQMPGSSLMQGKGKMK